MITGDTKAVAGDQDQDKINVSKGQNNIWFRAHMSALIASGEYIMGCGELGTLQLAATRPPWQSV